MVGRALMWMFHLTVALDMLSLAKDLKVSPGWRRARGPAIMQDVHVVCFGMRQVWKDGSMPGQGESK